MLIEVQHTHFLHSLARISRHKSGVEAVRCSQFINLFVLQLVHLLLDLVHFIKLSRVEGSGALF